MGRVCITVNLLIDQIIILYLLLHEITLEFRIDWPGCLLNSEKIHPDMLIPATPFIYICKIFHPPIL